jgi:hypothetical protein
MIINKKRLPYGNSNFSSIITENYAYIDKTRFIELLENENNKYQFFIRPRKFGKSLFYSMLDHYYDLNEADNFEKLFGNLYIGKHPTPKRNSYAVMKFNFSGRDTSSKERFIISFSNSIRSSVRTFITSYRSYFPEADVLIRMINEEKQGVDSLQLAYEAATKAGIKIFVLIDEYDHFINDIITTGKFTDKETRTTTEAINRFVCNFYETLQIGTSDVVDRIFITGVLPIMLNDWIGGFNIADNLTLKKKYNEMMGFTQDEVDALMIECGIDPASIIVDIQLFYKGYLFNENGENRIYHPSAILYFFNHLQNNNKPPIEMIDTNLKIPYEYLRPLVENEPNRTHFIKIATDEGVESDIVEKFPITRIYDNKYLASLLVYMGLLTIDKKEEGSLRLKIPTYFTKTMFWEYFMALVINN